MVKVKNLLYLGLHSCNPKLEIGLPKPLFDHRLVLLMITESSTPFFRFPFDFLRRVEPL
jgi:hypothetical protein